MMAIFTQEQLNGVKEIYDGLCASRADYSEIMKQMLRERMPELDEEAMEVACMDLDCSGMGGVLHNVHAQLRTQMERVSVWDALNNYLRDLTPQERKGLYLMIYEAYRQSDAQVCPEAGTARHDYQLVPEYDEVGLQELAAELLELHAGDILAEAAAMPKVVGKNWDDELLAAAFCLASARGILPGCFADNPRFVALCCDVDWVLHPLLRQTESWSIERLYVLIALAVELGVYWAVAPWTVQASDAMLRALNDGTFHQITKSILAAAIASQRDSEGMIQKAAAMYPQRNLSGFYAMLQPEQEDEDEAPALPESQEPEANS